jgi:hypothetical protein
MFTLITEDKSDVHLSYERMFALLIANKSLKIQRGNQKPQIEGHTTQWPKEK